tara:strand:- start:260 stop:595 length:336 start_codon:yes stop_codon:yes gene_type:complete
MTNTNNNKIHKIRQLNDQFRVSFKETEVRTTIWVDTMTKADYTTLIKAIQNYDLFEKDETDDHSFGTVRIFDRDFYFKIDCYANSYTHKFGDPASPTETKRIITIATKGAV